MIVSQSDDAPVYWLVQRSNSAHRHIWHLSQYGIVIIVPTYSVTASSSPGRVAMIDSSGKEIQLMPC